MELKSLRDPETKQWLRSFDVGGRKCIILKQEEGIGIERYSHFKKMSAVLGMNASFGNLIEQIETLESYFNSLVTKEPRLTEMAVLLNNMKRGVLETGIDRYEKALYLCTLFIVWEDEDLTTWDKGQAEEKIKAWNKAGYNEQDFLALGLSSIAGFVKVYREFSRELEVMNEKVEQSLDTTESTRKDES